eukprot:m.141046 g.141046  ORF g.141046 m.141046 type:complete len:220 (-) comp30160_c1_seq2:271-930(-)
MENDRELEHLRNVESQIDHVTDDSVNATRNMLKIANQTRDVGAKTLEELDGQGEQLRRVNQDLKGINNEMREAEKQLTQMEKCCGCCSCPCGRPKSFEKSPAYTYKKGGDKNKDGEEDEEDDTITEQPRSSARYQGGGAKGEQQEFIKRITGDAREDEMNDNMQAVSSILGDLKAQAMAMGTEIDEQDEIMDDIAKGVDSNEQRVEAANKRAMNILRKA